MDKLERKLRKYAIHNLTMYLVAGYIIGYMLSRVAPQIYAMLLFNPYEILKGQVWRIFTWILTLPDSSNFLLYLIMIAFYYSLGNILEREWGAVRYNLYIFSGMIFTVIGSFILYFAVTTIYKSTGDVSWLFDSAQLAEMGIEGKYALGVDFDTVNSWIGMLMGMSVSTYYINMSIFLAFAMTYPDMQVLLYFIIPLKIKWLGALYGAFIVYELIEANWMVRVVILVSLLNFIVFFFLTRDYRRVSPNEIRRKRTYRNKVKEAQKSAMYESGVRHKCAVCGRTDKDYPDLVFRYCSKCSGGKEYCQDHLFTHEHK